MRIKAKSKFIVFQMGKMIKITQSIKAKFAIFHKTKVSAENSTFIKACIKEITEEFIKLNKEKIDMIKIETKETIVLYQGINSATAIDKNIIKIHKINLKLITFQIILETLEIFSLFFDISLTEMA